MPEFSREAPVVKVLIDGNHEPLLQPLRIEWSVGGKRLDFAELELDHGKHKRHRKEFREWVGGKFHDANEVKIIVTVDDEEHTAHVGRLAVMKPEVDETTERLTFISRLEKWHFGKPLVGIRAYSPRGAGRTNPHDFSSKKFDDVVEVHEGFRDVVDNLKITLHDKVVFNLNLNGTVYGTMFKHHGLAPIPVFAPANIIPPPDPSHVIYGDDIITNWELNDVILYLCDAINSKEDVIANVTERQLSNQIGVPEGLIRNLKLRQGIYLNEALDDVLSPLGYGWFLDYAAGDKPRISVYYRPDGADDFGRELVGPSVQARLRIPESEEDDAGFPLDMETMNVTRLNLRIDKSAAVNEVGVLGDFVEVEFTFALHLGWPEDKDSLVKEGQTLLRGDSVFDDNPNVGRLFVLNEAGDYTFLRPEIDKVANFDVIFGSGEWTESRRRFLPTITTGDNGEPMRPRVEYLDPATLEWEEAKESFRILTEECGIWFDGDLPPFWIADQIGQFNLNNTASVRITATVRGDRKVAALIEREDDAPNKDRVRIVLNAQGRFKRRIVHDESIFSGTEGAGIRATDDQAALRTYATQLRESVNRVHTTGVITFEGVEPVFQKIVGLGWNAEKIKGAGIALGSGPDRDDTPFPTVAGITMDFKTQRTVATIEAFRGREK